MLALASRWGNRPGDAVRLREELRPNRPLRSTERAREFERDSGRAVMESMMERDRDRTEETDGEREMLDIFVRSGGVRGRIWFGLTRVQLSC